MRYFNCLIQIINGLTLSIMFIARQDQLLHITRVPIFS